MFDMVIGHVLIVRLKSTAAKEKLMMSGKFKEKEALKRALEEFSVAREITRHRKHIDGFDGVESSTRVARLPLKEGKTMESLSYQLRFTGGPALVRSAETLTAKFQDTTEDFEHSTGSDAATLEAAEKTSTCKEKEVAPENSPSEEMTLDAMTSKRRLEDLGASSAVASELALRHLEYQWKLTGKIVQPFHSRKEGRPAELYSIHCVLLLLGHEKKIKKEPNGMSTPSMRQAFYCEHEMDDSKSSILRLAPFTEAVGRQGEGDGISAELLESCQKLLQAPEYRYASTSPIAVRRRFRAGFRIGHDCRDGRFNFVSFNSRLLAQPKTKQADKHHQHWHWPRWDLSAMVRRRFHKLASWMHALRLPLKLPGEAPPDRSSYQNSLGPEERSLIIGRGVSADRHGGPDIFQDVPF
ncbi:hypothetical protein HPB47_023121 [Ixodes persulcatus]|uniref:Uncharacterized protein n=1 Tax=Ixodes persulcatus TaxID=34615 RepID=A0AC60Q8C4_IXOPE|nr:hypothetical protein HPB47_023121 [Ixodes persulcatus]